MNKKFKPFIELFEDCALAKPEKKAIDSPQEAKTLTYGELNTLANKVAHKLHNLGIKKNTLVGIASDRRINSYVAIIALLKVRAVIVPLDLNYPKARIDFIIKDSNLSYILTNDDKSSLSPSFINIESLFDNFDSVAKLKSATINYQDPLYVIYTSGSTGKPKGVLLSQGAVAEFLKWERNYYDCLENEKVLQFSPLNFDIFFQEFLTTLSTGKHLIILPQQYRNQPDKLLAFIQSEQVNKILLPYTILAELADYISTNSTYPKYLNKVVNVGEAFIPTPAINNWIEVQQECSFYNLYGASENQIVSIYKITSNDKTVPIGSGTPDNEIFILDDFYNLISSGQIGMLYVSSNLLSDGYLGHPALTAETFIANPFASKGGSRLYKTGDLVKLLPDGNLKYIGRQDFQIKIKGYRIELGEVENTLNSFKGVKQSTIIVKGVDKVLNSHKSLIGYYVSDLPLNENEIISYLSSKLPSYMLPSMLIHLSHLPLTPNGKVDRNALPTPDSRSTLGIYVKPRDKTEESICQIWSEIFGLATIGIHDDFFSLGGDSITSLRITNQLRQKLEINLAVQDIFNLKTIQKIYDSINTNINSNKLSDIHLSQFSLESKDFTGKLIDNNLPKNYRKHLTINDIGNIISSDYLSKLQQNKEIEGIYLANNLQQGFIYHYLKQGHIDTAYRSQLIWEYTDNLDIDSLKKAWQYAQQKFSALRLRFAWEEQVIQIIDKKGYLHWEYKDLSDENNSDQSIEKIKKQDISTKYDLAESCLFRLYLFKRSQNLYTFILSNHHIILDGWSVYILLQYVHEVYANLLNNKAIVLETDEQYKISQKYLQSNIDKHKAYWDRYLSCVEEKVDLSHLLLNNTYKTTEHDYIHKQQEQKLIIQGDLYKQLKELSKQEGVTFNAVFQYIWHKVLSVYGNSNKTVVGTTVSGRDIPVSDIDKLVGLYINTLPLLVDHNTNNQSIIKIIKKIQADINEINSKSNVNLSSIQKNSERLFDSLFVYENYPFDNKGANIRFKSWIIKEDYPLVVVVNELDNRFLLSIKYAQELFSEKLINQVLSVAKQILKQILTSPYQDPKSIQYISYATAEKLLTKNCLYPLYHQSKTIHQLFEEQMAKTPESIALIYQDIQLSYQELNARTNKLAYYLNQLGVTSETLVAVAIQPSLDMIIAFLGILKAGGAYVPLDTRYPTEHVQYIINDAGISVILTDQANEGKLPISLAQVICLDNSEDLLNTLPPENYNLINSVPESLAYITYTSGSTGFPKGVMTTHNSVISLVCNVDYVNIKPTDAFLQLADTSFDATTFEIWGPLLNGAKLVIPENKISLLNGSKIFSQFLNSNNVSILFLTTALFDQLFLVDDSIFQSLDYLLVGGETLNMALVNKLTSSKNSPENFLNIYGPTESTTFSCGFNVTKYNTNTNLLPIGKPITNRSAYILDSYLNLVPPNTIGELYLGGEGLARGYLNNPGLTGEKFIANPFQTPKEKNLKKNSRLYKTGDLVKLLCDGNLEYIGRNDFQIKIRGYRIEPALIEKFLSSFSGIKQSVVLAKGDNNLSKYLVGYYVADAELNDIEILNYLRSKLPEYMVPNTLIHLNTMPLTINGKIDRKALPQPLSAHITQNTEPTSKLEKEVCDVWAEVLGLSQVGVNQDFFKLGGNSILAIKLVSLLNKRISLTVSIMDIFECKNIQTLLERKSSTFEEKTNDEYEEINV